MSGKAVRLSLLFLVAMSATNILVFAQGSVSANFGSFYGVNGAQFLSVLPDSAPDGGACTYSLVSGGKARARVALL